MKVGGSVLAVFLLVLTASGAAITPTSAAAASSSSGALSGLAAPRDSTTGTITGLVVDQNSNPVGGVCVSAVPTNMVLATASTISASDGRYTIGNLGMSGYLVNFDPTCGGTVTSLFGFSAGEATIVPGLTVVVDGVLPPADGSISGVVTGSGGGPLAGVCVTAIFGGFMYSSITTSDGSYKVGMAPETYSVEFDPTCGNAKPSPWQAMTISGVVVNPAVTTTENPTLSAGGTLVGTVTDSGGNPVSGVCLLLIPLGGQAANTGPSPETDANGHYTVVGVVPGSYSVMFDPACYGSEQTSLGIGYGFATVTATATTVLNATLAAPGTIAGTVTDSSTHPVQGVCVSISGAVGALATKTASNGTYTIGRLSSGDYSVSFDPTCGGTISSTLAVATVSSVAVTTGSATTVNETLAAATVGGNGTSGGGTSGGGTSGGGTSGGGGATAGSGGSTTVAPPPPGVKPGVLAPFPSYSSNAAASQTIPVTSDGNLTVQLLVPSGALPASDEMGIYAIANLSDVSRYLRSGQLVATGVAVSWISPDSSTPPAVPPITVELLSSDIVVDDVIYIMGPSGQFHAVGTVSHDGTATVTLGAPALIVVATEPRSPVSAAPRRTVRVSFASTSAVLSSVARSALGTMTKQLRSGATVVVTGYAKGDRTLATKRDQIVKWFLLAHRHVNVIARIVTTRALSLVTVAVLRQ